VCYGVLGIYFHRYSSIKKKWLMNTSVSFDSCPG
jgi:hypothetical protein